MTLPPLPEAAHDLLAEMAELAAEKRGAFLEEETL